jgi:integrase
MPKVQLTDRFCQHAKPDATGRTDYFDVATKGLALRCSAGHRTWTFHFTSPKDGKRARITLGSYPATSLAEARTKAIEARGYLEESPPRDPRDVVASEEGGAMTVSALVPLYLEKPNRRTGRPRKSVKEIERRFNRNIIPIIGTVKLADLHRRDANRVVVPIQARKRPTEAARVFEDLRAMVRWAVGQGYIDRNPMEAMEPPSRGAARERVLTEDEIRTLWNGLPKSLARSKACQRIVKLCLVTAQRVGEVAGMERRELDLKAATWTIPGARSKNGFEHSVPLSPLAVDLIQEALEAAGEEAEFVFPEGDGPLPASAVARTISRAHEPDKERPKGRFGIDHWTAHDLRRTAVNMMAALGVTPIVLGHVINHRSVTKAGVTLSVYSQYAYAQERREALELWADRLSAIVAGKRVAQMVPLRTG